MCGRFVITPDAVSALPGHFGIGSEELPEFGASYNHAPSYSTPVVGLAAAGARGLALLKWGLVPSWSAEEKPSRAPINARAETVAEKPTFREAYRRRRCLVPASGWYEWSKTEDGGKQPFLLWPDFAGAPHAGGLHAYAGIWESRPGADGPLRTFAILTAEARPEVAEVHHRMPVVLRPEEYALWLGEAGQAGEEDARAALLDPAGRPSLSAHPVAALVNSPRNSGADCIAPLGA